MNLANSSEENLSFILKELANMLGVANKSLFKPKDYDIKKYDDLKLMYDMVVKKETLSPLEIQAFLGELKKARKTM